MTAERAPQTRRAPHHARYTSLGVGFRVRCDDREIVDRLDDLYSACRRAEEDGTVDVDLEIRPGAGTGFEMRANGELHCDDASRHDVLEWSAWLINNLATQRSPHLVLHAGAAARGEQAVIVTGPSGSGKSTLVTALVLAGMTYLGDDSISVAAGGRGIRSNPKPMSLDDDARRALSLATSEGLIAPHSVGAVADAESEWKPAVIVRPLFRPGGGTAVAPLTPAEAAELLADQSFNFSSVGSGGLHAVAGLGRRCRAFTVEYGEASGAVGAIAQALDAPVTPEASTIDGFEPAMPHLDIEILADEALIWDRRACELHRLSPAATAIWRAYGRSRDPAAIAASLRARMHDPAPVSQQTVQASVERCIDELVARGLLARAED